MSPGLSVRLCPCVENKHLSPPRFILTIRVCVCVRQEEDRRSPPPTHMLHAFFRLCHVVWRFLPSHVNKYSEPGILRSLAFRVQGVLRAFVVATEISGRSGRKLGAHEKTSVAMKIGLLVLMGVCVFGQGHCDTLVSL